MFAGLKETGRKTSRKDGSVSGLGSAGLWGHSGVVILQVTLQNKDHSSGHSKVLKAHSTVQTVTTKAICTWKVKQNNHWRRQLWGIGARTLPDFQQFIISVFSSLWHCIKSDNDSVQWSHKHFTVCDSSCCKFSGDYANIVCVIFVRRQIIIIYANFVPPFHLLPIAPNPGDVTENQCCNNINVSCSITFMQAPKYSRSKVVADNHVTSPGGARCLHQASCHT